MKQYKDSSSTFPTIWSNLTDRKDAWIFESGDFCRLEGRVLNTYSNSIAVSDITSVYAILSFTGII